jgi:hypothetical protein
MELEDDFQMGRERAFVVGCAAAVEGTVAEFGGEWIDGPVGAVDGNDVFMGEHEDGAPGAGAFEAGDDAGTAGDGFKELIGNAFPLEDGSEIVGHFGLVAGRVLGIDLDEVGEEGGGFLSGGFRGEDAGGRRNGLRAGGDNGTSEKGGKSDGEECGTAVHPIELLGFEFGMDS